VRCLREELRRERRAIEGRRRDELPAVAGEPVPEEHVHCPTCGTALPVAQAEEAADEAEHAVGAGESRRRLAAAGGTS
jgi:hypothetical protein